MCALLKAASVSLEWRFRYFVLNWLTLASLSVSYQAWVIFLSKILNLRMRLNATHNCCTNVLAAADEHSCMAIWNIFNCHASLRLHLVVKVASARPDQAIVSRSAKSARRRRRQLPSWRTALKEHSGVDDDDEFYGATTKDCCDPQDSRAR